MAQAIQDHPRLKQRYETDLRPQPAARSLGSATSCRCPASRRSCSTAASASATEQKIAARRRRRRPDRDHRAEAARHPGEEVHRRVQAPGGETPSAPKVTASRRPHVGVLRPARESGDPTHSRDFRGMEPSLVRRARQLQRSASPSSSSFPEIDYDSIDTVRGMDITIGHDQRAPTTKAGRCSPALGFPVPSRERTARARGKSIGEEGVDPEAATEAQVQGAGVHPVPAFGGPGRALGVPALRAVPYLSCVTWPTTARSPASRRRPGDRMDDGPIPSPTCSRGSAMPTSRFHDDVVMPSSKLKVALAKILEQEGYISGSSIEDDSSYPRPRLRIAMKYTRLIASARSRGCGACRSRACGSTRPADKLPRVLGGMGIAILSTNQGLMTDREARQPPRRRRGPVSGLVAEQVMSRVGKEPIAIFPRGSTSPSRVAGSS